MMLNQVRWAWLTHTCINRSRSLDLFELHTLDRFAKDDVNNVCKQRLSSMAVQRNFWSQSIRVRGDIADMLPVQGLWQTPGSYEPHSQLRKRVITMGKIGM